MILLYIELCFVCTSRKTLLVLRILANFLVCIVLASSTYAIYLLVQRSKEVEKWVERGEKVNWFTQNEVSRISIYLNYIDNNFGNRVLLPRCPWPCPSSQPSSQAYLT